MEPDPQMISDKLWSILQVFMFMVKRGISKNKMVLDLQHLMMKRGKTAKRAIEHLVLNNHSTFSCKSHDAHRSFISPREYEFSCSNTPAYRFPTTTKRKHHRRHSDELPAVNGVRKMFEMLNSEVEAAASPLVLPGVGKSPLVRQLRITDSPFPLGDCEETSPVDMLAEEFIERFYEQLRQQKRMAAFEVRNQTTWGRKNPG